MRIIASVGRKDIAVVYIAELGEGKFVECVESLQPPSPREKKWVLLVSTMFGCPIGCLMCDAGGHYLGNLTREEIFAQLDFLVKKRFPNGKVPSSQFKIQFARMGEPSLNPGVLDVLESLPERYRAPGLMPSLSTVAPAGCQRFFEQLLKIKQAHYSAGNFQFQFSIHTTDNSLRDKIIPTRKLSYAEIAEYGGRFFAPGDRKITLNFALAQGMPVESAVLLKYFSTDIFLIKMTPLNPTYRAAENKLSSLIDSEQDGNRNETVKALRATGYDVIVSLGEPEENSIGSNCGQYVRRHLETQQPLKNAYTYRLRDIRMSAVPGWRRP